jgi:hypothetical protein
MSVVVSFVTPRGIGSVDAPAIGGCRVRETITVPGTTMAAVADGEMVLISSGESAIVLAAHGTVPDAAAAAQTAATSAGYPIPTSGFIPVMAKVGDRINIKALV